MAFQNKNTATVAATQDTSWKAQAFINLYIPTADGGRRKIGAIALKEARSFEAQLIARLQEDGAVQALADVLQIDFQMADQPAASLGF